MAEADVLVVIIAIIVVAHLLGIVLIIVNSIYLLCTRDIKKKSTRCYKITNFKAFTMLMLYHVILEVVGLISIVVVKMEANLNDNIYYTKDLVVTLQIATFVNYCFILFYLGPCAFSVDRHTSHAHNIGCLHSHNIFAFCNFFVFWFLCAAMIMFVLKDYSQTEFHILSKGYGLVPIAAAYIAMVIEASVSEIFILHTREPFIRRKVTRKEAVVLMEEALQKDPHIHWIITCGDMLCAETDQTFPNQNWVSLHGTPTEDLFTRKYTFLTIQTKIDVTGKGIEEELKHQVETFKEIHAHHNYPLKVAEQNRFYERYLVTDFESSVLSGRKLYWIFALCGLMVPFRGFLYFKVGDLKYKIKKVSREPPLEVAIDCTDV